MERKDWTKAENKIAELIYHCETAKDLEALEIAKKMSDLQNVLPILLCGWLSNRNANLNAKFISFIKKHLNIGDLSAAYVAPFGDYDFHFMKRHLPDEMLPELFYTHFRRLKKSVESFLISNSQNHHGRKEVFDVYLSKIQEWETNFQLPGLSKSELEKTFERLESKRGFYYHGAITNIDFNDVPHLKFNIHELEIKGGNCNKFPEQVFDLPYTQKLSIIDLKITDIPSQWNKCRYLNYLYFDNNDFVFKDFDFVKSIPNFKNIRLGSNFMESPYTLILNRRVNFGNPNFEFNNYHNFPKERTFNIGTYLVIQAGYAIGKSTIPETLKNDLFFKVSQMKDTNELREFSISDLLYLTYLKLPIIEKKLAVILKSKTETNFKSLNGAIVYCLGSPLIRDTKNNLKELGAKIIRKPNEEITHLVIGKKPKPIPTLEKMKFKFINELELKKYVETENPKFLQLGAKNNNFEIEKKVIELLESPDFVNVNIAFEMLKNGGVTENMLPSLLNVAKLSFDAKLVKNAKKILFENAPKDWHPVIKDRKIFKPKNWYPEKDFMQKLFELQKTGSKEAVGWLSIFLYKKYNIGLRYALIHFEDHPKIRGTAMKAMMKNLKFDYSSGIGHSPYVSTHKEKIKLRRVFKFPSEANTIEPNLKEVKNYLSELPDFLSDFKNLQSLNLSKNCFDEIPKVLYQMKHLRELHFLKNKSSKGKFKAPIGIEELKQHLTNCEIITKVT